LAVKKISWEILKTFTEGSALVEVSGSDTVPRRYSYRVTWSDNDKRGPWFPDRGISFLDSIAMVVGNAEDWILGERDRELREYEGRVADRRVKEEEKRKNHQESVKKREKYGKES